MRKRLCLVGVGAVLAAFLMSAAGASAATQVGDSCYANNWSESVVTAFLTIAPQSPLPTAVPTAGVVTSWGVNVGTAPSPGASTQVALKVLRLSPLTKTAQVVGESSGSVVAGSNSFNTRISVQAGDVVAVATTGSVLPVCEEPSPGGYVGLIPGAPSVGATVPYFEMAEEKGGVAIFATVEPDADGDGYGDETQDQCPTDASTQGPCPAPKTTTPPPPALAPSLSVSAAAKKTFLTANVTTTAQASVTVTGTVKLGKGKPVKLRGNTQTVTPGGLAKFTVLFPGKMKAALKKLPVSKKLTVKLSASAPGATTKNLTVKVPGQARPARHSTKEGR